MRAWLRWGLVVVLACAGCGEDDNPDAIDVKNLKYPQGLQVVDNGDGSATLSWNASNFEKEFEGYSVYAAALTDEDIAKLADQGLEKGKPLQLLDDEGEPRNEAKAILAQMDYNATEGLSVQDESTTEEDQASEKTADSDDPKFSFYPVHAKDAEGAAILPTCYPAAGEISSQYTCQNYTAENVESVKDEEDGELAAHGTVTYEVDGLKYDTQYCFLVFSVQDSGEEISQTSTNFECVRPKYGFQGSLDVSANQQIKIASFAEACATDGSCPAELAGNDYIDTTSTSNSSATGDFYIDRIALLNKSYFGTGKQGKCGIKDFGYRADGYSDENLPNEASVFANEVNEDGKISNTNGYSAPGMSVYIRPKAVYVLACLDSENEGKVFYHWIYVSEKSSPNATEITVDLRLSGTSR